MKRSHLSTALSLAVVAACSVITGCAHASGPTVGLLLSDYVSSSRWQYDRTDYEAALHKLEPNANIIVEDAKGDETRQQQQAQALLTEGAKVLVVVPVDAVQAKSIVSSAHQEQPPVPVLSYDRVISDASVDAYVTFNNFNVGVAQAKYLVGHLRKGATIIELAGSPSDNNALVFHDGAMSVLRPLASKGDIKIGYSKFTPQWDSIAGQQEMTSALTLLSNHVDGVLAANDNLAGGAIAALKAQHLAGKVLVTGQDATVAGLQDILLGTQSMTVYKPIPVLANAAARVTADFLNGKTFHGSGRTEGVPTDFFPVITVTRDNIAATVIHDGFVTKQQLCTGLPASACSNI